MNKNLFTSSALLLSLVLIFGSCKKSFEDEDYTSDTSSSSSSSSSNGSVTTEETTSSSNVTTSESSDDYIISTNESDITYIHCNNTSFSIEGNTSAVDVKSSSLKCEIIQSGTFYIDGTLDDGQIQVDAASALVKIVLNGATLNSNADQAALRIKDCEKTIITIADGTTNTITDTKNNEDSAAIYSKQYLAFNSGSKGDGILKIQAQCADGIGSKGQLVINNGKFDITSTDDGIRGKACLVIHNGDYTINAGGDGLKSTSEDAGYGYIAIDNGTFDISATDEGIQAENNIEILNGTYTIVCNKGKGIAASSFIHIENGDFDITSGEADGIHSSLGYVKIDNGTFSIISPTDGIQAEGNLTINDGKYTITKADKCISALGDITINGGTFTLTPNVTGSGENGSGHGITVKKNDSDVRTGNVTINGGVIDITKSYEGIQGVVITVNDGTIFIVSTDDAFNASNGTQTMGGGFGGGFGGRPGQTTTTTTTTSTMALNIKGGFIHVTSTGDGLDSNGEMNISGGIVLVSQNSNANEPLDAGDGYEPKISGGVVVAVGSQGMASAPSATQTAVFTSLSGSAKKYLAVNDASGNNILAWQVPQTYQVATISAPELQSASYNFLTNATVSGNEYIEGSGFYYPAESAQGTASTTLTLKSGSCTSNSNRF